MTEVPQFRVFLKESQDDIGLNSLFPDGIPCNNFFSQDYNNMVPKDLCFEIYYNFCSEFQIKKIFRSLGEEHEDKQLDLEHHPFLIDFDEIKKVIDINDSEISLDVLKKSWIISNHVKKIPEIITTISGETTHAILLGLQQALFVDTPFRSGLNKLFFGITIGMIEQLSLNNPTLKEYFISSFPDDYVEEARKRLLS